MRRYSLILALLAALGAFAAADPLYNATPQTGSIAYSAVDGTNLATSDTVITLTGRRRILLVTNSLNAAVMLTFNGADFISLPAATGIAIDLSASGLTLAASAIKVYHLGTAPTVSGFLSITAL